MRCELQQCFTLLAFVAAVLNWTSVVAAEIGAAEIDAAAVRTAWVKRAGCPMISREIVEVGPRQ